MVIILAWILHLTYSQPAKPVPAYILDYGPLVHLYSEEVYLPSNIEKYLSHFTVSPSDHQQTVLTPSRLGACGRNSESRYLETADRFETNPPWLTGQAPEIESGLARHAPAVLIIVDKGQTVDAFWFFFYSFNLGPFVMGGGPYGNHLGDWEHVLVRFDKAKRLPRTVWMSAHGGGTAYEYTAMEKLRDIRPVVYSARGTHANYASVGQHSHDVPFYILSDFTDKGTLWDPTLNHVAYWYNETHVQHGNGSHPNREVEWANWLDYRGLWGNRKLPPWDARQKWTPFEWKYIDGPTGPLTKNLMRKSPCQRHKWWNLLSSCRVRHRVEPGEGVEASGARCAGLLNNLRPLVFQYLIRAITWHGGFCVLLDTLLG